MQSNHKEMLNNCRDAKPQREAKQLQRCKTTTDGKQPQRDVKQLKRFKTTNKCKPAAKVQNNHKEILNNNEKMLNNQRDVKQLQRCKMTTNRCRRSSGVTCLYMHVYIYMI